VSIAQDRQTPDASPTVTLRGLSLALLAAIRASATDRVSLPAAGCAFYATLALFPSISVVISIYGLVFDPASVVPHLAVVRELMPDAAFMLIEERVLQLVNHQGDRLSLGLLISVMLSLWSSASGTKSLLAALNLTNDLREHRSFTRYQVTALAMTLIAAVCAVMSIGVLLILPPVIAFTGLSQHGADLIDAGGMAALILYFTAAMAMLYRHGPCRPPPPARFIIPGAILATLLWLAASELLSFYVARIASFGATYGSLGAVAGVMLWFYVSAYAILLGAELNARLEHPAGGQRIQPPPP